MDKILAQENNCDIQYKSPIEKLVDICCEDHTGSIPYSPSIGHGQSITYSIQNGQGQTGSITYSIANTQNHPLTVTTPNSYGLFSSVLGNETLPICQDHICEVHNTVINDVGFLLDKSLDSTDHGDNVYITRMDPSDVSSNDLVTHDLAAIDEATSHLVDNPEAIQCVYTDIEKPTYGATAVKCYTVIDNVATNDIATQDIATHDITTHDIAIHDIATHDIAKHDIATHDIATHDIATHDIATHDTATHDTAAHDIPAHNIAAHGIEAHDIAAHDFAITELALNDHEARAIGLPTNDHSTRVELTYDHLTHTIATGNHATCDKKTNDCDIHDIAANDHLVHRITHYNELSHNLKTVGKPTSDVAMRDLARRNITNDNSITGDTPESNKITADTIKVQTSIKPLTDIQTDINRINGSNSDRIVEKSLNTDRRGVQVKDLNPLISCVLCGGYFVDATTIVECFHSFCRSCIVSYLEVSSYCPVCDVRVHERHPLIGIRRDKVLQNLVYKLVPGLFSSELKRQNDFYFKHSQAVEIDRKCGNMLDECWDIIEDDELISISLELQNRDNCTESCIWKRYLLCPAKFSISLLKKFLRAKLSLSSIFQVEVYHSDEELSGGLTLRDIVYIYSWQKRSPFQLYYTVFRKIQQPTRRTESIQKYTSLSASPSASSSKSTSMQKYTSLSASPSTSSTRSAVPADQDRNPMSEQGRSDVIVRRRRRNDVVLTSESDRWSAGVIHKPTFRRQAISPIYPITAYDNPTSSDDSDAQDPTFRISTPHYKRKSAHQSKSRKRRCNRRTNKPLGIREVGFYPRYSSTPKDDEHHKVYCRFAKSYVPVYKRNYDPLNTAVLVDPAKESCHNERDIYHFEDSVAHAQTNTSMKRKRGRPRKYPLPISQSGNTPFAKSVAVKRGRGRPSKYFKGSSDNPNNSIPSRQSGTSRNCRGSTVASNDTTGIIKWIPTNNSSRFIPSIPVSLNISEIGIHPIKVETPCRCDLDDSSTSLSSPLPLLSSSSLCSDGSVKDANIVKDRNSRILNNKEKCQHFTSRKPPANGVNDNGPMYNTDLAIKQEVEENYPNLRKIIEGRCLGGKHTTKIREETCRVAKFEALNAKLSL